MESTLQNRLADESTSEISRSEGEYLLTAILVLFQTTLRILGFPRVDIRTCLAIVIRHWMDRHPLYREWSGTMKDEFTRWMIDWLAHEPWLREWFEQTLAAMDDDSPYPEIHPENSVH